MMQRQQIKTAASRYLYDYGMVLVLLLLALFYSVKTLDEQHPNGAAAAEDLARELTSELARGDRVLVVARDSEEDAAFADRLRIRLEESGVEVVAVVKGQPSDARRALEEASRTPDGLRVIATNHVAASWGVLVGINKRFPALGAVRIRTPRSYHWPNFLKIDNLLNVANQIAVIAILAIGMTLVIITAGIDLSVGSLIALSAVVSTFLIREAAGGTDATVGGMTACALAGVAACAIMGLLSGAMVTFLSVPPFIMTLAWMLVARGLAFMIAEGQSIYEVPDGFVWLGRGADLVGIPNAVVLMAILYVAAHVLMTRTTLGRYIYAVGGNTEAARLSGVSVPLVILFVYVVCGALSGLGGVVMASQLKSGSPTYGVMYELHTIAAVVVGGTSLSGGEGKILGTLIGAFIIAVNQNGMNLIGLGSYPQMVVLGMVILAAVLVDKLRRRGR